MKNYIELCANKEYPEASRCYRRTTPPKLGRPGREFSGEIIVGVFVCSHYIDANAEHYSRTTAAVHNK